MKQIIITGANSGLGFETAKKVAARPATHVVLACRNLEKAEQAKELIIAETGNQNVTVEELDTSSLASVRQCAERILATGEPVDVLVNNAGISAMGHSGTTADGFEVVFATNYLGHFLLTQLLLPAMPDGSRILNTTSDMHSPPGGIDWPGVEAIAHPTEDDRHKYSYSKLCNIYFTYELDRRLREEGRHIAVNAFNPGFMAATNFSKGNGRFREKMVQTTMPERYGKLETSSDALADLVTEDRFADISGKYFDRSTETAPSSDLSYNEENAKELWEKSLQYVG